MSQSELPTIIDRLMRLYGGESYESVYGVEESMRGLQQRDERRILDDYFARQIAAREGVGLTEEVRDDLEYHGFGWLATQFDSQAAALTAKDAEIERLTDELESEKSRCSSAVAAAKNVITNVESQLTAALARAEKVERERDKTPVDEAWLRSFGGQPVATWHNENGFIIGEQLILLKKAHGWQVVVGSEKFLSAVSTRGDVLRLMSALGIAPAAEGEGK